MKRWLFAILAAISLALLLTTTAAWVRSYWYYDRWVGQSGGWGPTLTLDKGQASVTWLPGDGSPLLRMDEWHAGGFAFGRSDLFNTSRSIHEPQPFEELVAITATPFKPPIVVQFPIWCPELLLGLLSGGMLMGMIRTRRRKQAGLCAKCGYDLRASTPHFPDDFSSLIEPTHV